MTMILLNSEVLDRNRDVVTYTAVVNNERVACAITSEALCDNFGGNYNEAIETFRAYRPRIEAKTESLIQQGRYEEDGSIIIYSQDGA